MVLILVAIIYSKLKKNISGNENANFVSIILFFSLWLISGFRVAGTDYIAYRNYFEIIDAYSLSFPLYERGYYLLNKLISICTDNYQYVFIITSFITIYLISTTLKKYSVSYFFSLFLFVSLYFYYNSFNLVRQYIAIAIVFYSLKYILNKNFKRFLIGTLVASLFHTTALVILPFYWLARLKIDNFVYFILPFITFGVSFFTPTIVKLISFIYPKFDAYVNYNSEGASSYSIIIISAFTLLYSLVYKKRLLDINKGNLIIINLVYFSLIFTILSMENILFFRVSMYLYIFIVLLIPVCFKTLNRYLRVSTYFFSIPIFIAYNYYLFINNTGGVLPYDFNFKLSFFDSNMIIILIVLSLLFFTVRLIKISRLFLKVKL